MTDDLQRRALTAARCVAIEHGLALSDPVILPAASNVLLHLRPHPVVARVMTATGLLHPDPQRWLTRELSVLRFLAPHGVAVAPSAKIAPGPHHRDGLWMTFTEWVPDARSATGITDPRRLGQSLKALHETLRGFAGPLGTIAELRERIRRVQDQLSPSNAHASGEVAALKARLEELQASVFESSHPVQALHGDVSLRNLFATPSGLLWNDFEDTFRGPVHWDLASYISSLQSNGADGAFIDNMLDAYGWEDPDALVPFLQAQDVYDDSWRMYLQLRRAPA